MAEKNSKDDSKVLSIADQEVLAKEEVQKILKLAKDKGRVTIEEINESLAQELVAISVLDALMQTLEANGVIIAEHTEAARGDEKETTQEDEVRLENAFQGTDGLSLVKFLEVRAKGATPRHASPN